MVRAERQAKRGSEVQRGRECRCRRWQRRQREAGEEERRQKERRGALLLLPGRKERR